MPVITPYHLMGDTQRRTACTRRRSRALPLPHHPTSPHITSLAPILPPLPLSRVVLKMGPKHDMGDLLPKEEDGWKFAMAGNDWAVWERA